jgi:DNA polymerase-3 subunit delta
MATKPKNAGDAAGFRQLKQDLKNKAPAPLYIFYGEEDYLRDYYLDRLQALCVPAGMESFNVHRLSGTGLELQALSDAVDALPMMSPRTFVRVDDYDLFKAPEKQRTAMTGLLTDLPDYCTLVFVYDTIPYKSDARMKKLAAAIREAGREVCFARQGQHDLTDWIIRRFRALDRDISAGDAQYLIFLCGDLMNGLIGEIAKIGAYARQRRVTKEDIDAVAIPVLDAQVFAMTDALTKKNYDRTLSVLNDLLLLKQEPIMLLAVLGKQIRQLYSARVGLESGKDSRWLMKLWSMRSVYPADKLMEAARRHDLAWCRRAMARCAQTDLAMKSVTGADAKDRLVSLILELAAGGPA